MQFLGIFIVILALIIFCILCISIRTICKKYKNLKTEAVKPVSQEKDSYLSPVQVGYLIKENIDYNHIIATVLHYIEKGYITVEKVILEEGKVSYKLSKSNSQVFKFYTQDLITNINKENLEKLKEYETTISDIFIIERFIFDTYDCVNIEKISEYYNNFTALKAKSKILEAIIFRELVVLEIFKPNTTFLTSLGRKVKRKWLKFGFKIKNDTLLYERRVEEIALWGDNLVYGVALGICKATEEDINKIYKGIVKNL